MTTWLGIVGSLLAAAVLGLRWWVTTSKRRRIERERTNQDDMAQDVASGNAAGIAGKLNALGLQAHADDKRQGNSGP